MKFHLEDITQHAKGGWASLAIYSSYGKWVSPLIDYPDEWFHVLEIGDKPRIGKKSGYVHLSRAGFQAFEPDLFAAFQQSNNASFPTWDLYKAALEAHFAQVEKARLKLIAKYEKILEELKNFNV